jgi:hypothetical protein
MRCIHTLLANLTNGALHKLDFWQLQSGNLAEGMLWGEGR